MIDKLLGAGESVYRQMAAKRRLEAEARREKVACRVLSVGNLSVGGTGKTPCVQWAARVLQSEGRRVAVVSRGYGGSASREGGVVSDGQSVLLDAAQSGDEPLLHARALPGVVVLVGRDRAAMCRRAAAEFGCEVAILDDGFQFWSLERDCDLLLLDARRPFDNGHLLPRGRLREAPREAARADAILLTRAALASPAQLHSAREAVARETNAPIWTASHAPRDLRDEQSGALLGLESLRGARVAALSALADNEAFGAALRNEGAQVVARLGRRDHHVWREAEVRAFAVTALKSGGAMLVTTEKDAVKLSPDWAAPLPSDTPLPLRALRIEMKIDDEAALRQLLLSKLP